MTNRYLARRLFQVVPTVLGVVLIGFVLVHVAPGDPVLVLAGEHGDAAYYAFIRERFGLDQPLPQQLGTYLIRIASGDFGYSYVHGRPALAVIAERIPATLLLTGTALVLAIAIAIPLGAAAARRPHGSRDIGISGAALALHSAPTFWIGQLALVIFALRLGIAPVQGMTDPGSASAGLARLAEVGRHLALPAMVLALQELAVLVRLTRSGVLDVLARDHVRTARSKGVAEWSVLVRHALPVGLLPALTVVGARMGYLIAGATVVEVVFGWPGMGRMMVASLQARDAPVLLALFFLIAFTVVLANLLTDLIHAFIDPRIR